MPRLGPILVALGALLWASDMIFRARLVATYSPLFMVFLNHWICVICLLPFCWRHLRALRRFSRADWLAVIFLGIGSSAAAMIFFTMAFAATHDYAVPALVQKVQPLFAIALARLTLKERLPNKFWLWLVIAMLGVYLLAFGATWVGPSLYATAFAPIFYALLAAAIWGAGTVAGRSLSLHHSFLVVTTARYVVATIFLSALILLHGSWPEIKLIQGHDTLWFLLMALLPGLVALLVYYRGMQTTDASTASLAELTFPLGTVVFSWLFLDAPLTSPQLLGAACLMYAVLAASRPRT